MQLEGANINQAVNLVVADTLFYCVHKSVPCTCMMREQCYCIDCPFIVQKIGTPLC